MSGNLKNAIQAPPVQKMLNDPKYLDQIQIALPKGLEAKRMARVALTEIRKNPMLAQCDPLSIFGGVMVASQLGLEIGGHLGHAYLIPFKRDAQLIIGYRGMIDLARRSGQVVSLQARCVKENDLFEYELGLNESINHKMPENPAQDRGKTIAAYAIAKLVGGGHQIEVLRLEDIEKAKRSSKDKRENSVWNTEFDEMAKKTAIRRLFKYLPVSTDLQRAVMLDEYAESGVPQNNRDFIDLDKSEFQETEISEEPIVSQAAEDFFDEK